MRKQAYIESYKKDIKELQESLIEENQKLIQNSLLMRKNIGKRNRIILKKYHHQQLKKINEIKTEIEDKFDTIEKINSTVE